MADSVLSRVATAMQALRTLQSMSAAGVFTVHVPWYIYAPLICAGVLVATAVARFTIGCLLPALPRELSLIFRVTQIIATIAFLASATYTFVQLVPFEATPRDLGWGRLL